MIPLSDIPHPREDSLFTSAEWHDYCAKVVAFLKGRGWMLTTLGANAPRGYSIASGPSPRIAGAYHSCVALDGKVVHDPHPDATGLSSIHEYEILVPLA